MPPPGPNALLPIFHPEGGLPPPFLSFVLVSLPNGRDKNKRQPLEITGDNTASIRPPVFTSAIPVVPRKGVVPRNQI